jgi:anaerobic ribonucleoside-triphosphate reductase activating protein
LNGSRASGYYANELLNICDVLVDGRFVSELKDISLKFRGSSNQRVIDLNKTRELGVITLLSFS